MEDDWESSGDETDVEDADAVDPRDMEDGLVAPSDAGDEPSAEEEEEEIEKPADPRGVSHAASHRGGARVKRAKVGVSEAGPAEEAAGAKKKTKKINPNSAVFFVRVFGFYPSLTLRSHPVHPSRLAALIHHLL